MTMVLDLRKENKFICNSENRWPSDALNLRLGVHKPIIKNLPKLRFATSLLEPNDGYIEPCFTLTSNAYFPENFTRIPNELWVVVPTTITLQNRLYKT